MTIQIWGAGMSGLLAGKLLQNNKPVIYEATSELPNNHAALLRFRSDIVSRATGIPFKKVWVQKAVLENGVLTNSPSIATQNLYSFKVTGKVTGRSIGNLSPGERYIAPDNFIEQLAEGQEIKFSCPLQELKKCDSPQISTIPMPALMKMAGWSEGLDFRHLDIISLTATVQVPECEVYQTIYFPYDDQAAYRASLTGDKLIVEFLTSTFTCRYGPEPDLEAICKQYLSHFVSWKPTVGCKFKDPKTKRQYYGKLIPGQEQARKEFIMAMTDLYNLYSVGRFATWRQILMDDVVKDIEHVRSMLENRDSYSKRLNGRKG